MTWRSTDSWASGCSVGGLGCAFVGVLPVGLATYAWPLSEDRFAPLLALVVALGALTGFVVGLFDVHTVTFSGDRVRAVSRMTSRTVRITELTAVSVRHEGDTEAGYTSTTLRVGLRNGRTLRISGDHDPSLASRIGQVIGDRPPVEEVRDELRTPPEPGA